MIACFLFPQIGIAVERVRALNLWGEPFALAGADGALAAVSDLAERFGIRAGHSPASARALCPGLIVLPYDRAAYESAMQTVWNALAVESSFVEPNEPERVYVDFSGREVYERVRALVEALAARMRTTVQAGLARTKLTAYQAALQAQDRQVVVVPAGMETDFLAEVSVASLAQIDSKLQASLVRLGVRKLGELLQLPAQELQRQFRPRGVAASLQRLAQGLDGDPVRALWPPRTVQCRIALDYEAIDRAAVEECLRRGARTIAADLLQAREFARSLCVRLRLADESAVQQEARLTAPIHSETGVYQAAVRLLSKLPPVGQAVTGIEIEAGELGIGVGIQMALFDANESGSGYPHERRRRLEEALGYIRGRFGVAAIVPLRLLSQARRIHLWTYPLGHLLSETVEVATGRQGAPVRYWRGGQVYEVVGVQDRWREAEPVWQELVESVTYRVETNPPPGFYELSRIGQTWRVVAVQD